MKGYEDKEWDDVKMSSYEDMKIRYCKDKRYKDKKMGT